MKTIIAATDFSTASVNAIKYAADMAVAIQANLLLLNISEIPAGYLEVAAAANIDAIVRDNEKEMSKLKEGLSHLTNLHITSEVRSGFFYNELLETCNRIKPYVVVIGNKGKSLTQKIISGQHAVYAMKHLPWPLITVPEDAAFHKIKKIGMACDLNQVIESLPTEEIQQLVEDFDAKLHVLYMKEEKNFSAETIEESGWLQELLCNLQPKYHFSHHENIDQGILEFADKYQIDLLIVLPKRHSLIDYLVHRSHTKQIVLHSHIPVLALHQLAS